MDIDTLQLVAKAKAGDTQAFEQLYDLYAGRIFRYINLKIQDATQAQDILQETFLKSWKGLDNLNLVEVNFSAWLYKIAGNCINDYFRKKYRSPQVVELEEAVAISSKDNVAEKLMLEADFKTVENAFAKLPSQYRQILELRFIQDFSLKETADILQKNAVSVRVLQFRALKSLKEILAKDNYALEQ